MFLRLVLLAAALSGALPAAAFETRAEAAYVVDVTTGTVLLAKDADLPLPPASMSKLMTLNMLFEAIRTNPNVELDTRFRVSTRAKNMGGSTMFLNEQDRPTVEQLIRGIVVQSGNDATVVVAEGLAGTEEAFADLMTERARALGMEHSTFTNASGWPAPNHRMSMRDLGILAVRLITEFPDFYTYFAEREWGYDGRAPQNRFNRNPLLSLDIGADGLKTGHTQEAGYGLVGSAKQGDRRVVFVITGLETEADRAEEAERIIAWAFRQFVQKTVARGGTVLAEAEVWLGDQSMVGLRVVEDLELLLPALSQEQVSAEIQHVGPLVAPISEGQEIGRLIVSRDGLDPVEVPLVADRNIVKGGFLPRLKTAANVLATRFFGESEVLERVLQ